MYQTLVAIVLCCGIIGNFVEGNDVKKNFFSNTTTNLNAEKIEAEEIFPISIVSEIPPVIVIDDEVEENCNQWDEETMHMIDDPIDYLINGASYEDYLEDFQWLYWNYNLCSNADIQPLPNPEG